MKRLKTLTERQVLLALMGLAFVLCLPMIILNDFPGHDTSRYYSAMIREFGVGNWERAFYHMIPPLFPVVGGIFAMMGFAAFTAAKIASTLFFCLALLPLYYLHKLVWDRRVATVACLMFVFCSRLLRYAGAGILNSGKIFFLTLTVYALAKFIKERSWRSSLLCGAGAAGLTLIRGEGVIFAVLALIGLAVAALWRRPTAEERNLLAPAKLMAAVLVFLTLISPWLIYEYRHTGYFVTDSRQIETLNRLRRALGWQKQRPPDEVPQKARAGRTDQAESSGRDSTGHPVSASQERTSNWLRMFDEIFKGSYPLYLILVIPVIIWRLRRQEWSRWESYVLAWVAGHTLCFLSLRFIEKRYIIAAMPLMFGWGALGVLAGYRFLLRKLPQRGALLANILIGIAVCSLVWDGTKKTRPHFTLEKRRGKEAVHDTARWLRETGRQRVPERYTRLKSSLPVYHNGRLPVLCSLDPVITFLAESDQTGPPANASMTLAQLQTFCAEHRANFIIVDRAMLKIFPGLGNLENLPKDFSIEYAKWRHLKRPVWVIGYKPNLKPGPQTITPEQNNRPR